MTMPAPSSIPPVDPKVKLTFEIRKDAASIERTIKALLRRTESLVALLQKDHGVEPTVKKKC